MVETAEGEVLRLYEGMFLVSAREGALDEILAHVLEIVMKHGGQIEASEKWAERKLAYEIKHNWRGTYYVGRFTLPTKDERETSDNETNVIAEITRQVNLNQDILRYIIVNTADLPPFSDFAKQFDKTQKEDKKQLKETGEKIDGKLEEALNI